jgi:glucose dehydrogenase
LEDLMQRPTKRLFCVPAAACATAALAVSVTGASAQSFVPVNTMLSNPDPADWLMINRTYDEQRFSPLGEINTGNVGHLRMAWARGLPNGTQVTGFERRARALARSDLRRAC